MNSKMDVRMLVYMIKNNKDNRINPEAFEDKSLAELIMEARYTEYWIQNKYVEVIAVPVKFLKK